MKNLRQISFSAVLLFLVFVSLAGCSNNFLDKIAAPANDTDKKASVILSISAESQFDGATARTVTPDNNPAISAYVLSGALSGAVPSKLADFATLSGATIALAPGVWDFTLSAKNSDGIVFLSGTQAGVVLSSSAISLVFTLAPLTSGSGTVQVTVTWPSSVAVSSVIPSLGQSAQSALSIVDVSKCKRRDFYLKLSIR